MNIETTIEHSILKPDVSIDEIRKYCEEAIEYHFTAVAVPPLFVKTAKEFIGERNIFVATVIGFPYGYNAIESKLAEVVLALVDGADELNMVINMLALKNNDWQYLAREINTILPVIRSKRKKIKVIIECALLSNEEIIRCCDLYGAAGVDFIQTSTGIAENPVTIEMVLLIRKHLSDQVQIKVDGDVDDYDKALAYIKAGISRIGSSQSVQIVKAGVDERKGMIFENN